MRHIIILSLMLTCASTMAQDIEIKGMKQVKATPEASARKDLNGNACGLLRVKMAEDGAQFTGNIIGNVDYVKGEYLVYMTNGSKRLSIKHPNYLPITIVFSEYDIKKIESNTEYQMVTKLHKEKQQRDPKRKGVAMIQVVPISSRLFMDGEEVASDGGGLSTLNLPYGTHYYTIKYGNFSLSNLPVNIDKHPKMVKVNLTEYFAQLHVKCADNDAQIFVNNQFRGAGSYEDLVTPGTYIIQAKKDGFHTLSQTVVATDRDSIAVELKGMTPITGSLEINYEPIDAEVILDGKSVGKTPLKLNGISVGLHFVEIKKENCSVARTQCKVEENSLTTLKGQLKMSSWEFLLNKAKQGNCRAMFLLGYSIFSTDRKQDYFSWVKHEADVDIEPIDPIWEGAYVIDIPKDGTPAEAVKWFKMAAEQSTDAKLKVSAMLSTWRCCQKMKRYDEAYKWIKAAYDVIRLNIDDYEDYVINSIKDILAWHLYHGFGVERNRQEAWNLFYGNAHHDDFDEHFEKIEDFGVVNIPLDLL